MDNDRIIQVIPCTKPMIAVFEPVEDEEYSFSWIYYLGLTESGHIEPLDCCEGFFDNVASFRNYTGVWYDGDKVIEREKFCKQLKAWKENKSEH